MPLIKQEISSIQELENPAELSAPQLLQLAKAAELPALAICGETTDLDHLEPIARRWRTSFTDVVVLGMGGSSLGAQLFNSFMTVQGQQGCTLHFCDNSDPVLIGRLLHGLPPQSTGVIAVSKSGGTVETLLQTQLFVQHYSNELSQLNKQLSDHFYVITEEKASPLSGLAAQYGLPTLVHHSGIGGRYSAFSNVGLFPALLAGMDVRALRKGAHKTLRDFTAAPATHHATQGAQWHGAGWESGYTTHVLMPYASRLHLLGAWHAQLWAESLGKQGFGSTPVSAIGATDQHSTLQLFLDGPNNKLFTLILPNHTAADTPAVTVGGQTFTAGQLLAAQGEATADSLRHFGRPLRIWRTPALDEAALGALMMTLMLETIATAALWGIDAFNQPAVEDGKQRTVARLVNTKAA